MDKKTTELLQEWHSLLQSGAITQQEFNKKKQEIIGYKSNTEARHFSNFEAIDSAEKPDTLYKQYDTEDANYTEQKGWIKENKSWIIAVVGIIGLIVCTYFGYNYFNNSDKSTASSSNAIQVGDDDAGSIAIHSLLTAENNRNIDGILAHFSPHIRQYWDLHNPSVTQLQNRYFSAWRKTTYSKNELLSIEKVNNSTYIYAVNYTIFSKKDQKEKQFNDQKIKVLFDKNFKILSIMQL